ncbi:MAG: FtsQ-type POTRA domain-containing protein [Spirochaetaceae bacterium]|nr:FtsQ-type POTRA domain-containing protein [Spirochaetaceae bacterium]
MKFTKRHIVIVVLIALIPLQYLYFFADPRSAALRRIVLNSNIDVSDEFILDILGLSYDTSFAAINPQLVAQQITERISLSNVVVEKRRGRTLYISLVAHSSIAAFIDDSHIPHFIDANGQIFSTIARSELMPPLISGLSFSNNNGTIEVSDNFKDFLTNLSFLKRENYLLFTLIESIDIVQNNFGHYNLWVSFIDLPNKAIWPLNFNSARLYNSIVVLNLLNNLNILSDYNIDFRTDEIVFVR